MSNDRVDRRQLRLNSWVVDIGDILENVPFSDILPNIESNQASITDSEEKPSIFCHNPRLVYFGHSFSHAYFQIKLRSIARTPFEPIWNDVVDRVRREFRGWQFVAFMRRWFDLDVPSYLEYIQEKEHLAGGYYSNAYYNTTDSDTKYFLDYLLINSCIIVFSILLFQNVRNGIEILSGTKEKTRDPKDQRSIEFYILYQYIMKNPMEIKLQLLTMEYQMPWFVVECIYKNHSTLSNLVGIPIEKLALSCFDDLYPGVHKSKVHDGTGTLPTGDFKHLLHMFHWSRTPEGKFLVETRSLQPIKKMENFYLPSATDLKLSATVFEKHAGIDVSYCEKRLSGVMQIAPLHIFKYSSVIYENLLRFERDYMDCGFPVTAYIASMMNLLLTEADAKLLRANGIVPSTGNDLKDVLSFVQQFKPIHSDDACMPNDLNILSQKVRQHHERSYSRSYAELKSRYFANPWITISVIAGIILFILTFIQTVLSYIQTKYSVLSYKKQ